MQKNNKKHYKETSIRINQRIDYAIIYVMIDMVIVCLRIDWIIVDRRIGCRIGNQDRCYRELDRKAECIKFRGKDC